VKEVLTSIPLRRRESKEFPPFKRKLLGLVILEFMVATLAIILFIAYSLKIDVLNFNKLYFSILAISPVYISFSLLEMLQEFIHGPFSPLRPPEASALNESDFFDSATDENVKQVFTSRMDVESSVQLQEFDSEGSPSKMASTSGMHKSDFQDSTPSESNPRGRWFTATKRTLGL
jgi:hypothetical protein